ncbi:MAG: hypothetical protein HDS14_03090 [Bacteroides sp.]|nr:hypothetical protein [Bacteroides sp.]
MKNYTSSHRNSIVAHPTPQIWHISSNPPSRLFGNLNFSSSGTPEISQNTCPNFSGAIFQIGFSVAGARRPRSAAGRGLICEKAFEKIKTHP